MENQELTLEDIKGKTVKGIAALTGRNFVLQVIALISTFLLTIFLNPAQYGTFFLVSAAVNFFAYFSDIGLAAALIQKKESLKSEELKTTFIVQQILVVSLVTLIFILTPILQTFYNLGQESVYLIWALAVSLVLSSLKTIPSVLLERKLDFNKLVIPQIVETVLFYLVAVYLAWKGFGIASFTFAVLVRGFSGLFLIYLFQPWMPGFNFSFVALKRLLKFGLPYQANTFLAVFKDDGMTVFLGGLIGPSGIGYLGWAQKWAQAPLRFFMDQVIKVTFPAYSRLQHDPHELSSAVNRSIFFISLLVFPTLIGLVIIAPTLTQIIPKYEKWQPALLALSLISINTAFAAITTPLTNLLNATGKIHITFRFMIMWTTLTWISIPLLSLKFGFNGAALGYALIGFSSTIAIYVASKYVKVNFWQTTVKPLMAATIMGILIYIGQTYLPISLLSIILLILAGAVVYFLAIVLLIGNSIFKDVRKILQSLFVVLLLVSLFLFPKTVNGVTNQFITIINPIRGKDFFQLENTKPYDNLKKQINEIEKRDLSATWLLRPDALSDPDVVNSLKNLRPDQEVGLFMEVTPTWTKMAGVEYIKSQSWHFAGSVFLTGYEVNERQKLIDSAFSRFKEVFGYFPKSVGAWWIDAGSLSYMREKYDILANMDVADQYSTDNYSVWGQYFSTPFYPAKRNALIPASSQEQKIGVVSVQWATRDPFNSFGNGVLDSTYSVQSNDYANKKYHNLNTDYFKKLISIYLDNPHSFFGQVTVGLENDFSWEDFGEEYKRQLDVVGERKKRGTRVLTLNQFANSYKQLFPNTSPPQIIFAQDPLSSGGYVLWYQNLKYRIGWFYSNRGSLIRDLRLFYDSHEEPCLLKRCDNLNLANLEEASIDEVTNKNEWIIDEGRISDIEINPQNNKLILTYTNQAGLKRDIAFLQNDISLDGQSLPIPVWITRAQKNPQIIKESENHFNFQLKDTSSQILLQLKGFLFFIIFSVLAFYLPGAAILKKLDVDKNHKSLLAIPIGIATFTLFAFLFGMLNFRWGIVILPLISVLVLKKDWILPKITWSKKNLLTMIVILTGSLSWLATSLKNGLVYDYGMGFWGPHGHDGVWHLGLIEAIKKGLPPENPAFAGDKLINYHYFYDLLLAQTSLLTNIEPLDLYFRFFPILITLSLGGVVYILAKKWFSSSLTAIFSCFFVYFGGSFGWVLSYFKDRSLGGETAFWAQQGVSTLINPPFAISLLTFLAGLYLFHKVTEQKGQVLPLVIPLVILWGTLIEFKAYAGILVLGALAIISVVEVLRRNFLFLSISIPTILLSLLVFLPNNSGSGTLLVFSPFWLVHSMVDSPDRVGWFRLQLARMAGLDSGNWFKFAAAEIIGLLTFTIGNLGTRIVGLLSLRKVWPTSSFNLFIFFFLLISFIFPLTFIQKGASFNSIQFFYYFLLMGDFLAASGLYFLMKKLKGLGMILAVLMMFLTLPTTWNTLGQYLPVRPPARISNFELDALKFLKQQPDGVVLSYYHDKYLKENLNEPIPLLAYESTMYVSAFSNKKEYIADSVNLIILSIDYKGRLQVQKDIFSFKEPEMTKKLLKENNIKYVYLPKIVQQSADERFGLRKIFENKEVLIYENVI